MPIRLLPLLLGRRLEDLQELVVWDLADPLPFLVEVGQDLPQPRHPVVQQEHEVPNVVGARPHAVANQGPCLVEDRQPAQTRGFAHLREVVGQYREEHVRPDEDERHRESEQPHHGRDGIHLVQRREVSEACEHHQRADVGSVDRGPRLDLGAEQEEAAEREVLEGDEQHKREVDHVLRRRVQGPGDGGHGRLPEEAPEEAEEEEERVGEHRDPVHRFVLDAHAQALHHHAQRQLGRASLDAVRLLHRERSVCGWGFLGNQLLQLLDSRGDQVHGLQQEHEAGHQEDADDDPEPIQLHPRVAAEADADALALAVHHFLDSHQQQDHDEQAPNAAQGDHRIRPHRRVQRPHVQGHL
mmetsp:Transcript_15890/g.45548  ORF Transcript_15890/g.45548 Transcript_15890/m.45548 type:complete len:355 (-) Transcript_15890:1420-2484(-)